MSTAIKVENLGKKYIIKHQQQSHYQYNSLGESLSRGFRNLGNNLLHPFQGDTSFENTEEFWALRDINFEINHGDRVGIIGRNGAGKSTLLKILSRITHPSTGKITINGRVLSLLEVGTGFHPELTGRENIFLNGAILGMRKIEIKKKFDEIVDFAEIEKFLDTPVKHYSSGMYVRLAFAVAAHLEPEILIIDEVLAVGDAKFQSKCLEKMNKLGEDGRTILFVSHDISIALRLASVAIWIDKGRIINNNLIDIVSREYIEFSYNYSNSGSWKGMVGDESIAINSLQLDQEKTGIPYLTSEEINLYIDIVVQKTIYNLVVGIEIENLHGIIIAYSAQHDDPSLNMPINTEPGNYKFIIKIPGNTFAEGRYRIIPDIAIHNVKRITNEISIVFDVINVDGLGSILKGNGERCKNIFRPKWVWKVS